MSGNQQPSIDAAEHIGFPDDGENIQAKRTAQYGFDGENWQRISIPLINVAYDYITINYPLDTREVYIFKSGGSSGVTVATLTLNYTDSTKESLSTVART